MKAIETVTEKCSDKFDLYNTKQLIQELNLYDIPYPKSGPGLFTGMFGYGKQWAVKFYTEDKTFTHDGGWCWQKTNSQIWATDVNYELYKRRVEDNKSKLYVPNYKFGKYKSLDVEQYIYHNGVRYREGDILKVEIQTDNGWRTDNHTIYGLISWHICCGGQLGNWHNVLEFGHNTTDYNGSKVRCSVYELYKSQIQITKVEPKEGYRYLPDWARKHWRIIHNITGRPKF